MDTRKFEIELDGQRVVVNQAAQEIQILDEAGHVISCERIQVAAASIAGLMEPSLGVVDAVVRNGAERNA